MAEKRRTPAQWRELVQGWPRSGETQADYCRRHGIAVSTFHRWRERLRQETQPRQPVSADALQPVTLLPVRLADRPPPPPSPETSAALTVVFTNGLRLEIAAGCDPSTLSQVIGLLQTPGAT
jgi:transposase-like protein